MCWAMAPASLSALLVFFVREEKTSRGARGQHSPRHEIPRLPSSFWRLTVPLVAVSVINFSDALLLLRLVELGLSPTRVLLGYVGLAFVTGGPLVYVIIGAYGLFPALTDGVGKAWIASIVPNEHLGRAHGVFQAWSTGAILLAGLWAGLLWNVGPGNGVLPLLMSGSVAGIAALVFGSNVLRLPVNSLR